MQLNANKLNLTIFLKTLPARTDKHSKSAAEYLAAVKRRLVKDFFFLAILVMDKQPTPGQTAKGQLSKHMRQFGIFISYIIFFTNFLIFFL
jgi:hypothetical protein